MNQLTLFFFKKSLLYGKKATHRFDFLIMICGIIISVAVVVAAMNLFEGYQKTLKKILLEYNSHILIYPNNSQPFTSDDVTLIRKELVNRNEIKDIQAVYINSAMAKNNNISRGCFIKAYNGFMIPLWMKEYIVEGSDNTHENEVIIGRVLAQDLMLNIGDSLSLMYPNLSKSSLVGIGAKHSQFKISGILKTGYHEIDRSLIIMNESTAYNFFETPPNYNQIEIMLKSNYIDKASILIPEYSRILNNEYILSSWEENNGNLFALISLEKWLIFAVFSFLVLLAALNTISTVSVTIYDNKKDIAIFKTMGMEDTQIKKIFFLKVFSLCSLSILAGFIAGTGISWLITQQTLYKLKGDVYFIDKITMSISAINYIAVALLSFLIIGIALKLPFAQIKKLQVIDILSSR